MRSRESLSIGSAHGHPAGYILGTRGGCKGKNNGSYGKYKYNLRIRNWAHSAQIICRRSTYFVLRALLESMNDRNVISDIAKAPGCMIIVSWIQ